MAMKYSVMPSSEKKKLKDLHLASSVGDLNKLADPGLPVYRNANPATYLKVADKVYLKAQSHDLEGDEENAYVFYMRFFNIISLIKKSSKYAENKKYYDDLMGKSKTLQSIDRAEALQKSLDKRYEKLKPQKEANLKAEDEAKRKEEEDKKALMSKKAQNNGVDRDDNDLDSLLNGVGIHADEFHVNFKVRVMKDKESVKRKKKWSWRVRRRGDSGARRFPKELDQQEQKGVKKEETSQKELTGMQLQQELERERIHEQLREKDMQQQNLQRQSREMEQQLTNCHGQLRQKNEQLREKDEELREKDEELNEINDQVSEKDEQLGEKDEQLREKDEELREKDEELREKDEELREKDEQLREKDEQLREKDEELREKDEQLREKDEQLREINEQLRHKDEQLGEKDEQLREKVEQLSEINEQLRQKDEQLREKDKEQEHLQGQLGEMEQQLTNFEEQLREREEERVNLQQQNVNLERQLEDKDEEVNELEISLSTTQQTISEQRCQETCDWVISRDEIQISDKCLGRGGWGSVYEGMYCGSSVAVKQIHELILSPHNRRLFEREMNIGSRCRHPCLLQFIGATSDEGSPLFVTELMETSLRELLQQQQLSEQEIAVISLDVAKAINYLHEKKPEPIIHRDISSANVLLWRQGDQWRGKVSDYGTASFMKDTMTVAPGAFIYSAPEALTSNQTDKVDVYSFGVLMCEMCIRELPDPGKREEQVALVTNRALRGLVRRCLQTDPKLRPSMLEIIDSLRQFNV